MLISALCAWEDLRLVLHNRHGTRSCAKEGTPTLKAEASETHFPHRGLYIHTPWATTRPDKLAARESKVWDGSTQSNHPTVLPQRND